MEKAKAPFSLLLSPPNARLWPDIIGQRLLWLIRLRFIAIIFQLPLALAGRYYGYINQANHLIYTLLLVFVLIYNSYLYHKITFTKESQFRPSLLSFQISLDLIIFTYLLSLTGGDHNPFYAFFYVMAVLGGIFTIGNGSIIFFALLTICIFIIQSQPALSTNYAASIIFHPRTIPHLLTQLALPSITFLIAKSFGGLFDKNQKDLINVTIQAEQLDRLRAVGALSAGFSHEFASPLQTAIIRLKRLAKNIPGENSDLAECEKALHDCENVLKNMNSSQLQLINTDFELIDLPYVLKDIVEKWRADYPNIELDYTFIPTQVKVPRINFTQSIFNILDNSAEAMELKGLIKISIIQSKSFVHLAISDEGNGFDNEVLARIGEPFNTNKSNGTGLGLYSTKLFMESVAGKISIENNPNRGSKIELKFPRVGV